MRKIHILKAIVDLVWIISTISILVILALLFGVWFIDISDIGLRINSIEFNSNALSSKILLAASCISYLLLIAALYYFRKALHQFLRVKIFEVEVITSFKKIGNLLLTSGLISLFVYFIGNLYLMSKIHLEIGLNEHVIIICLGLFFMILSETFKIAKANKEENDLTI